MEASSDTQSTDPIYQRLAVKLRREIEDGIFPEGELLPTEHELTIRYNVSRQTVRAAIEILRRHGLIESRRGVGTRVLCRTRELSEKFSATSVRDLISLVQKTTLDIELRSRFILPPALAARFGGEAGSNWLYLGCTRRDAQDRSIQAWTDAYIDQRYAPLIENMGKLPTPLFEKIEAMEGRQTARIRQEIRAVVVSKAQSSRLDALPGSPALEITRSYYFDDGRLFEVAINTLPASRFHYAIELSGRQSE